MLKVFEKTFCAPIIIGAQDDCTIHHDRKWMENLIY